MPDQEKDYKFIATGGFLISPELKEVHAHDGTVVGFELPDGREVKLVIALEVSRDDEEFEYITSESEMDALGFRCLDYARLDFEEILPDDSLIEDARGRKLTYEQVVTLAQRNIHASGEHQDAENISRADLLQWATDADGAFHDPQVEFCGFEYQ